MLRELYPPSRLLRFGEAGSAFAQPVSSCASARQAPPSRSPAFAQPAGAQTVRDCASARQASSRSRAAVAFRIARMARTWPVVVGLLLSGAALEGHHSVLGFDGARPLTLRGVVAEVVWGNPHTYIAI